MKITINLFGGLRQGRCKGEQRDLAAGTTLRQAIAEVGIPEKEVGMALVNGRHAPLEHALSDGDVLALAP
jgi:molybdopterin synthase sulfur carrier subunit